ncbi:MAG: calcium-binding protein, partial [Cyanobacteria bacterium J06560_2]
QGGNGDDLLTGGSGRNVLNGGAGEDTVVYDVELSDLSFFGRANNFRVRGAGVGRDTVQNVEFLQVNDTLVATADLF